MFSHGTKPSPVLVARIHPGKRLQFHSVPENNRYYAACKMSFPSGVLFLPISVPDLQGFPRAFSCKDCAEYFKYFLSTRNDSDCILAISILIKVNYM